MLQKSYNHSGMVMIDLSAKDVNILLELIDIALDTRTTLDSTSDSFADLTHLSKKLNLDIKDIYTGNNLV